MKKFALLVGNGFTLDFLFSHQLALHSSYPLKNFNSLDINYNDFIDYLPTIKNELLGQDIEDFKAIENYASKYKSGSREDCELRRFIAIAYSIFQISVDKYDMQYWKWFKWLKQNKRNLTCAISFNYDRVLENLLMSVGIRYSRIGTNETIGVPVLKPHGSIDFDLHSSTIQMPVQMLWGINTHLNNIDSVSVVPKSDWLLPRIEADLIPPSRDNIQRGLHWVDSMFREYKSRAKELDALIIIGISYWNVDRPEIDLFLENLPKTAKVYIANPAPDRDLIKKIQSLGLSYETFSFQELPW